MSVTVRIKKQTAKNPLLSIQQHTILSLTRLQNSKELNTWDLGKRLRKGKKNIQKKVF